DQLDVHAGDLGEREDRVARPVEARHTRSIEGDLLLQRAAYRLHQVAFDLVPDAVGIDDLAAVVDDSKMRRAHHASLAVYLHRGDGADIGAIEFVLHVRDAASGGDVASLTLPRGATLPAGQADQPLQHRGAPRIVRIHCPD